jgi:chromate reductase
VRNELMGPVSIVEISGSLRKASFGTEIVRGLAKESAPAIQLHVVRLEGIHLYDEDLDTTKVVLAVNALKRLISSCDGVLILIPEYNHCISGALKNTLDWLSRPVFESCCQRQTDLGHQFLEGIHREPARAVSAWRVPGSFS